MWCCGLVAVRGGLWWCVCKPGLRPGTTSVLATDACVCLCRPRSGVLPLGFACSRRPPLVEVASGSAHSQLVRSLHQTEIRSRARSDLSFVKGLDETGCPLVRGRDSTLLMCVCGCVGQGESGWEGTLPIRLLSRRVLARRVERELGGPGSTSSCSDTIEFW